MGRKRYTPEFKSKIVLEILKEEKSLSQLSSEHGIHVNQLRQWKNKPWISYRRYLQTRIKNNGK